MQHLTLFTEDPDGEYPNQEVVWQKFERAFIAAAGLITHAPVLRDYLYGGLVELQLDNIMYLELRSGLSRVCVCLFFHTWSPALACLKSDISALMDCGFRHMSLMEPFTRRSGLWKRFKKLPRSLWRIIRTFSGLVSSFLFTGIKFTNELTETVRVFFQIPLNVVRPDVQRTSTRKRL